MKTTGKKTVGTQGEHYKAEAVEGTLSGGGRGERLQPETALAHRVASVPDSTDKLDEIIREASKEM